MSGRLVPYGPRFIWDGVQCCEWFLRSVSSKYWAAMCGRPIVLTFRVVAKVANVNAFQWGPENLSPGCNLHGGHAGGRELRSLSVEYSASDWQITEGIRARSEVV